jgi:hypothetical protein
MRGSNLSRKSCDARIVVVLPTHSQSRPPNVPAFSCGRQRKAEGRLTSSSAATPCRAAFVSVPVGVAMQALLRAGRTQGLSAMRAWRPWKARIWSSAVNHPDFGEARWGAGASFQFFLREYCAALKDEPQDSDSVLVFQICELRHERAATVTSISAFGPAAVLSQLKFSTWVGCVRHWTATFSVSTTAAQVGLVRDNQNQHKDSRPQSRISSPSASELHFDAPRLRPPNLYFHRSAESRRSRPGYPTQKVRGHVEFL